MDHEPETALNVRITFELDGKLEDGAVIDGVAGNILDKLHGIDFNAVGHFKAVYTRGEFDVQRGRNWPKEPKLKKSRK